MGRRRTRCFVCSPSRAAQPKPRIAERVPGEPFTLEHFQAWASRLILDTGSPWVLEPFQEMFVADLFGGVRECWLIVPEGNGKSSLVAGLALYHIEHRFEAWVTVAAASREQAGIVYRQASGLVARNDSLDGTFRSLPGYRRIERKDGSPATIQVMAADASTGDGVLPTFAIVDELHRHKNLDLYRTWAGKLWKRGGQIVVISTAGEPGGEFEVMRESFRQADDVTRDGCFVRAVTSQSVLHEWAVPEGGDVEDLELVAAANPFSGITAELLAEKRAAKSWALPHWTRFTCNLPTRSESAAIAEAEWYGARVDDEIPAGEPIWLGLDVAWQLDTTAAVPLWMPTREFRLLGPAHVLVPPRDGRSLDPNLVEHMLLTIHARNPVHTVVMDPTKAEQLAEWIEKTLGAVVVSRGQTNAFAVMDYSRFMEALRSGWLKHTGDADLTQHVLNATARLLPGGDLRFDRSARTRHPTGQERRVIDALSAASMVHSTASEMPAAPKAAPRAVDLAAA